jgi:2-polyprenyl-3-methyl-5-hydroxy-6-metoxy-1,4-benzoquinol methylase
MRHTTDVATSSPEEHTGYYDALWTHLGAQLHYTELMRVEFVVGELCSRVSGGRIKILDYGCGRGWMAPYLAQFGDVIGVDFSTSGIEFARSHYANYGQFRIGDSKHQLLGFEAASFDAIVCSEVIEHVGDAHKVIAQLRRLLRPNGLLLLTTPNGNVWDVFQSDRRFVHALQPVESWLRPSRLSQLLRAAQFKILVHEGRPMSAFRVGRTALLQRYWLFRAARLARVGSKYGRYILGDALYQVLAAERDGNV